MGDNDNITYLLQSLESIPVTYSKLSRSLQKACQRITIEDIKNKKKRHPYVDDEKSKYLHIDKTNLHSNHSAHSIFALDKFEEQRIKEEEDIKNGINEQLREKEEIRYKCLKEYNRIRYSNLMKMRTRNIGFPPPGAYTLHYESVDKKVPSVSMIHHQTSITRNYITQEPIIQIKKPRPIIQFNKEPIFNYRESSKTIMTQRKQSDNSLRKYNKEVTNASSQGQYQTLDLDERSINSIADFSFYNDKKVNNNKNNNQKEKLYPKREKSPFDRMSGRKSIKEKYKCPPLGFYYPNYSCIDKKNKCIIVLYDNIGYLIHPKVNQMSSRNSYLSPLQIKRNNHNSLSLKDLQRYSPDIAAYIMKNRNNHDDDFDMNVW